MRRYTFGQLHMRHKGAFGVRLWDALMGVFFEVVLDDSACHSPRNPLPIHFPSSNPALAQVSIDRPSPPKSDTRSKPQIPSR